MALKIRHAKKSDLKTCAKIIMEEFNKQGQLFSIETALVRLTELYKKNPDLCFCLEIHGDVIGLIFSTTYNYTLGKYLRIGEFAIQGNHQGDGHGKATLQYIEKYAKRKGFDVLTLETSTKQKAIKIYEKNGFQRTNYVLLEKKI